MTVEIRPAYGTITKEYSSVDERVVVVAAVVAAFADALLGTLGVG